MMKRLLFLLTAISILASSSIIAFAIVPVSLDHITAFKISLYNSPKEVYNFFYDWNKLPRNRKILTSSEYFEGGVRKLQLTFHSLERDVPFVIRDYNTNVIGFKLSCNYQTVKTVLFNYDDIVANVKYIPVINQVSSINGGSVHESTYFTSFSTNWKGDEDNPYVRPYDWEKNTVTRIEYDVDINKTYEEHESSKPPPSSSSEPPPPSSSSEPPKPPKPIDPPVVVPPEYDDTYVPYNPDVWQDFFDSISRDIGSATNIGFKVFGLLFGIYLIIKIVNHYKR